MTSLLALLLLATPEFGLLELRPVSEAPRKGWVEAVDPVAKTPIYLGDTVVEASDLAEVRCSAEPLVGGLAPSAIPRLLVATTQPPVNLLAVHLLNLLGQLRGNAPPELALQVTLIPSAAERFHRLTQAQVGQRVAIIAGGKVQSAPRVMEPISGGRLTITVSSPSELDALCAELKPLAGP